MTTPVAAIDATASPPTALRWLNATPIILGNPAGGAALAYNAARITNNCWLRFGGFGFLLTPVSVRMTRDDGQTWTTVLAFGATQTALEGLFIAYSAGVPRIVAVVADIAGLVSLYHSATGLSGSWVGPLGGIPLAGTITNGNGRSLPYGAMVVGINTDSGGAQGVFSYDPFAPAFVSYTLPAGYGPGSYHLVWDDSWVSVGRVTGAGVGQLGVTLFGVSSGTVLVMIDNVGTPDYQGGNAFQVAAWVDPTTSDLIVVARQNNGGAWKAFSVTSGLGVVDRTAAMIGAGALGTFGAASKIMGVVFDQVAVPGAAPEINLLIAASSVSGSLVSKFRYNGVGALMGDGVGAANETGVGSDVKYGLVNNNVGGERFFTPRPVGIDGQPEVELAGRTGLLVSATRRQLKAYYPRAQVLTTIGGAPATYNLAATPLTLVPIQPGSVTIRGVISAADQVAQDNGAGLFPVSTLLPAGGTINYATGAMTGVTASLDASSVVEALSNAGTASVRIYRTAAVSEYPAAVVQGDLSDPSNGTISGGNQNDGVPADGTQFEVTLDMLGFSTGVDRFNAQPYVE